MPRQDTDPDDVASLTRRSIPRGPDPRADSVVGVCGRRDEFDGLENVIDDVATRVERPASDEMGLERIPRATKARGA